MWKIVKIETQHLYNHTLKIVLQHCLWSLRQICKSTKQRVFSEQEGKRRKYLNRWQQSFLVFHLISHLIVSMCTLHGSQLLANTLWLQIVPLLWIWCADFCGIFLRGNYLQISLDVSLRRIVCVHLVPNGLRPGLFPDHLTTWPYRPQKYNKAP